MKIRNIASAYWIAPNGDFNSVTRHIDFISEHKEMFGLQQQEYLDYYKKYNEKIGIEGKTRIEIMTNAIKKGWVRTRCNDNTGWTIKV
jgi:hypothetical protein